MTYLNVFEVHRLAAHIALKWERNEYKTMTSAEAWEEGYDVEGDVQFWQNEEEWQNVTAIASVDNPTEVEINMHFPGQHRTYLLNLENAELQEI